MKVKEIPEAFQLTCRVHKEIGLPCCIVQRVLDLAEEILSTDDEVTYYDLAPIIRGRTGLPMIEIKAVLATADKIAEEDDAYEQD